MNQIQILGQKNRITEIKNSMDRFKANKIQLIK